MDPAPVAVCIPTLHRPSSLRALLDSIAIQRVQPRVILVLDAGDDRSTETVCRERASRFPEGVLRWVPTQRGLTLQRRHGIGLARDDPEVRYICMLDDDVTLEPDFLERTVGFLGSPEGAVYGGVSGYDVIWWGRPFEAVDRLYARFGLFDGELRPGRWLRCGRFLELSRLEPFEGVFDSDFIGGGLTVWRAEVFDRFQPPRAMDGYALFEDKHLSLRVSTVYRLGVLGEAVVQHQRAEGGRPRRIAMGFWFVRRLAMLLRDCDPQPSWSRYAYFLAFTAIDLVVQLVLSLLRLRLDGLPRIVGASIGWASCVVVPPRPTDDALHPDGVR